MGWMTVENILQHDQLVLTLAHIVGVFGSNLILGQQTKGSGSPQSPAIALHKSNMAMNKPQSISSDCEPLSCLYPCLPTKALRTFMWLENCQVIEVSLRTYKWLTVFGSGSKVLKDLSVLDMRKSGASIFALLYIYIQLDIHIQHIFIYMYIIVY